MNKSEKYKLIYRQIASLIDGEDDMIARMANIVALIHREMGFWWTGFYIVRHTGKDGIGELVLGPFQGPVACMHIGKGRGVCGTAWERGETIVVEDVEQFPGHIACSSESKSEIVVPIKKDGNVIAVLDIDSEKLSTFDEVDREWLEKIVTIP